jgi:hypothetical protein
MDWLQSRGSTHFNDSLPTHYQTPALRTLQITRCDSEQCSSPVSKLRSRSRKRAKCETWKTTRLDLYRVMQGARLFSRSMRCQNGSNRTTTHGFSTATGPYRNLCMLHSAVWGTFTTRQSISIPTSFQPWFSSPASGISCDTLLANIQESLAAILWLSHHSCLRRPFAMHLRLFIIFL